MSPERRVPLTDWEREEQLRARDEADELEDVPDAQEIAPEPEPEIPTVRMVGVELNSKQRSVLARILNEGEGDVTLAPMEDHVLVREPMLNAEWMIDEAGTARRQEVPF